MKYEIPAEVSANPAAVEFPSDRSGITAQLQKAGLHMSQKVYDQDQFDLVMAVYGTLIKHTQALFARTLADRKAVMAGLGFVGTGGTGGDVLISDGLDDKE